LSLSPGETKREPWIGYWECLQAGNENMLLFEKVGESIAK
jgi:hypothetical protein